jgi:CheY-like chemotaxis protein
MAKPIIAWVDDENAKLTLLVKPLQAAGYVLQRYRTYGEALDNVEQMRQAQLLIIDLIIPPGTADIEGRYLGLALLRQLRSLGLNQPAVVMSVVLYNTVKSELDQIPNVIEFINKTSPEPIEETLLEIVKKAIG